MPLNPNVFNTLVLVSLLKDYRGAIRNLIFILSFWLLSVYFGSYLFKEADLFYNNASAEPNVFFGYFLTVILLADFLAYFIKAKTIKFFVYRNKDVFLGRTGCLSILESLLIGTSIFCYMIPGVWMLKIIFHSMPTGNYILPVALALVIAKWGVISYQCLFMTPNVADKWEDEPKAPPKVLDHLADIILTITTTVLFTVVWQLGVTKYFLHYRPFNFNRDMYETVARAILYVLVLPFFCIALYLPTRLIFIMEDYYTLTNPKYRRAAFLSSVFAIVVSVGVAIYNTY